MSIDIKVGRGGTAAATAGGILGAVAGLGEWGPREVWSPGDNTGLTSVGAASSACICTNWALLYPILPCTTVLPPSPAGLGAAAGVLTGAVGGIASTVQRARVYMTEHVPASESVRQRVVARRQLLAREVELAAKASPPSMAVSAAVDGDNGRLRVKVGLPYPPPSAAVVAPSATGTSASSSAALSASAYVPAIDIAIRPQPFVMPEIQPDLTLKVSG